MLRSLTLHVLLLVIGSLVAIRAWTSDEESEASANEVTLWRAEPDTLRRVEFESNAVKVSLAAAKDDHGRYFVGSVDKVKRPDPHQPPHQEHAHTAQDVEPAGGAGADEAEPTAAGGAQALKAEPAAGGKGSLSGASSPDQAEEREQKRFVAVEEANKLAETLAVLKAKRALGRLAADRLEEFGFGGEEEGKLVLSFGDQIHELTLGGSTPGSSDVYVRTPDGEAYVIDGSIARDIKNADARLMQRSLREWEKDAATSVTLKTADATRRLVRLADQKSFWAAADQPDVKDETASNWMTKLLRLRINSYVEDADLELDPLVRVEFTDEEGKPLGFLEIAARDVAGEDRKEYLARSATSRWYGVVLRSSAEVLAQDLESVMAP
jgi:hypothetical protein